MLKTRYSGPAKVKVEYTIKEGHIDLKEDITRSEDIEGSLRLVVFKTQIAAIYGLPGLVSVHRANGEALTEDFAYLGDILQSEKNLIFRYDLSVPVAGGGIAMGGRAVGNAAFAKGGVAVGGLCLPDGSTLGGDAFGGGASGKQGEGGQAFAGIANNPRGEAKAGDGLGGLFVVTEQRAGGQ